MVFHNALVQSVKERVPIIRAAERYGYKPNRSGFIRCPFHQEDTPSLKIYPDSNSFYCFGCGVGGDVISFVRHLFHLDFSAAILRLDSDFTLFLKTGLSKREREKMRQEANEYQAAKRKDDKLRGMYQIHYNLASKAFLESWITLKEYMPASSQDNVSAAFLYALHHIGYLEYWLDEMKTFEKWKEVYG